MVYALLTWNIYYVGLLQWQVPNKQLSKGHQTSVFIVLLRQVSIILNNDAITWNRMPVAYSQDVPTGASCPPGGSHWGRKWGKMGENNGRISKVRKWSSSLDHPRLKIWLRHHWMEPLCSCLYTTVAKAQWPDLLQGQLDGPAIMAKNLGHLALPLP